MNRCNRMWTYLFLKVQAGYYDAADDCISAIVEKKEEKKMDVDLIFKIAAIGIIVAVLNQVLIRSGREEQAMMTTLAGLIVVLMMIINEINTLFETVKTIFGLG